MDIHVQVYLSIDLVEDLGLHFFDPQLHIFLSGRLRFDTILIVAFHENTPQIVLLIIILDFDWRMIIFFTWHLKLLRRWAFTVN